MMRLTAYQRIQDCAPHHYHDLHIVPGWLHYAAHSAGDINGDGAVLLIMIMLCSDAWMAP